MGRGGMGKSWYRREREVGGFSLYGECEVEVVIGVGPDVGESAVGELQSSVCLGMG